MSEKLQKKTLGDSHNFGRKVELIVPPDGKCFIKKPRSCFWEFFFFGSKSLLKDFLKTNKNDFSSLFQLDCYDTSENVSIHTPLIFKNSFLNKEILFEFMDICAYATFFGIADLNHENINYTEKGITILDVETVFTNLISVGQTGLIPNRSSSFSLSAAKLFFNKSLTLTKEEIEELVTKFIETYESLLTDNHLRNKIEQSVQDLITRPIRVFLRNTYEYQNLKNPTDSEMAQLNRGDIPYFFMFLNDKNVYFYTTPEYVYSKVCEKSQMSFYERKPSLFPEINFSLNITIQRQKLLISALDIVDFLSLFCADKQLVINCCAHIELNKEIGSIKDSRGNHFLLIRNFQDENGVDLIDSRLEEIEKGTVIIPDNQHSLYLTLSREK